MRVSRWVLLTAVLLATGLVGGCGSSGNGGSGSGGGPCTPNMMSVPGAPDDPCPQSGTSCQASGGVAIATCGADGRWPGVSGCVCKASASCGNGLIDPGEMCDGLALGTISCASLNGAGSTGTVMCNSDCAGVTPVCSTGGAGTGVLPGTAGTGM